MAEARHIGGLPPIERGLIEGDKFEVELSDGRSRRIAPEHLRAVVFAEATAAGLDLLRMDRAGQIAALGGGGGGGGAPTDVTARELLSVRLDVALGMQSQILLSLSLEQTS